VFKSVSGDPGAVFFAEKKHVYGGLKQAEPTLVAEATMARMAWMVQITPINHEDLW
jgi:Na+-translocating ferredoxin:NAD+ oxidoreductase RnfD subunit